MKKNNPNDMDAIMDAIWNKETKKGDIEIESDVNDVNYTVDMLNRVRKSKNDSGESAKKIAAKSVGNTKKTEDINRKSQKRNKDDLKLKIVSLLLATGIVFSAGLGAKIGYNIGINKTKDAILEQKTSYLIQLAEDKLDEFELGSYVGEKDLHVNNNSSFDYEKLNINANVGDKMAHLKVYIYKQILPYDEFDDFIKSVTYNDGAHNYLDFGQFLDINGYYGYDSIDTKEPVQFGSTSVFYNYMEDFIANNYEEILESFNADTINKGRSY